MSPRYLQTVGRQRNAASHQRDRWMVSYVDVLTILLIFFMVGAAKSLNTPPHKAAPPPPKPVATAPPPVAVVPPAAPARPDLVRAQQQLFTEGVETTIEPRGLVISLTQVVLFAPGADTVSPHALPTIERIAGVLRDIPNSVRLIGYADAVPIHNRRFHSNWELSMARSETILGLLTKRYGIPEERLSMASYGAYRPAASNETADGRAFNRRVEIVILDEASSGNPE